MEVRNSGSLAGDTVPQIYLDAPEQKIEDAAFAPRTLVSFDRVTLAPGESKTVSLDIAPRAFQYWSFRAGAWQTPPGSRTLHAGFSSRDLAATATLQ